MVLDQMVLDKMVLDQKALDTIFSVLFLGQMVLAVLMFDILL
jgi:hypothetical protein